MASLTTSAENEYPASTGRDSGWRTLFTIVLGIIFFLAFLGLVGGIVVRRHLLDPTLYTNALAENQIYERIYTDFLADPVIEDKIKEVTGINIDIVVGEAYAQVVSAAYLILPPNQMQRDAERFFTGLTRYLRGETEELPEDLGWGSALTPEVLADRIVKAATVVTMGAIDRGTPVVVEKTAPLVEDEVIAYLDQVSGGLISATPKRLRQMTVRGVLAGDNTGLINRMLGPAADSASPETKLQMEASLADDDLTGAMAVAIEERLKLRVDQLLTAAEPRLAESRALMGVSGAAAAIGETRDQLVAQLNLLRSYSLLLRNLMIVLALVMLASLLGIIWLNNDSLRAALAAAGWTLVISSGLLMLVWWVARIFLRSLLQSRLAATVFGPASLDAMIEDVVASLSRGIWGSIWQAAAPFFVIGLALLLIGYSKPLLALLSRLLAPVWDHKWLALGAIIGALVLIPLLWQLLTADGKTESQTCNGFVELCDRKANEIAYATSHNAMSIAEYRWIWPMHDGTITEQLNYGIRALLIDTHYLDTQERVGAVMAALPPELQPVAQKALNVIRAPTLEGQFLCHQLCGFGWTDLRASLTEVRTFLAENPREVLWIVIQDEITNLDTQNAFEEAGLLPYIYTHPTGAEWPTLRQMIDSNKRLVVMAENEGPPPDWYTNVWTETEETPYTFLNEAQFNCDVNRGDTGKNFFLLNHWIQRGAPNRIDGAIVNEYDFLLNRARQCQQERGKLPNFIAVNWYSQGDLVDVVNTLNGVGQPEAQ